MKPGVLLVGVFALAIGCDSGPQGPRVDPKIVAASLLPPQGAEPYRGACNAETVQRSQTARPELLIFVGAAHCQPCIDLGYQLRQLGRRGLLDQTAIVMGRRDEPVVCEYLAEERVAVTTRLATHLESAFASPNPIAMTLDADSVLQAVEVLASTSLSWVDLATLHSSPAGGER